jgi:CDP-glucose 4,6-dehydratase
MTPGFWRDKRVFVTGHTGFKGSWLVLLLQSFGARVAGYALPPPTRPSLYELARVDELVHGTTGDIRDLDALASCMADFAPDIVFHMAAQSVVLTSYDDPVDTYSTNVMGTVHTLEAVRRMRRGCTVVNVTTDKCYENKGWTWPYRETDTLGGRDPYSNSKACAELVGQAYRESFFPASRFDAHGVALASARAGNVIGGGDWTPRQLVPETIGAFVQGRPVVLRHPDAVRPWQHVLDCLGGYMTLAEALASDGRRYAGEWNFGPADSAACPVSRVVDTLGRLWGVATPWVRDTAVHAPEEHQLRLDVSKATHELRWRGRLPVEQALQWVAAWYLERQRGADARASCREQIARWLDLGERETA